MKFTKSYLRNIIKEELESLSEALPPRGFADQGNINISDDYAAGLKAYHDRPQLEKLKNITDPLEKIKYLKKIIDQAIDIKPDSAAKYVAENIVEFLKLK